MGNENTKQVVDAVAGVSAFAAWLSYLPEIAAVLSIIWLLIRIYEWSRVRLFGKHKDFDL